MKVAPSEVYLLVHTFFLWPRQITCHLERLVSEVELTKVFGRPREGFRELRLQNVVNVVFHSDEGWLRPVSFHGLDALGALGTTLRLLESHGELRVVLAKGVLGHHAGSILILILDILLVTIARARVDAVDFPHFNSSPIVCSAGFKLADELTVAVIREAKPMW